MATRHLASKKAAVFPIVYCYRMAKSTISHQGVPPGPEIPTIAGTFECEERRRWSKSSSVLRTQRYSGTRLRRTVDSLDYRNRLPRLA